MKYVALAIALAATGCQGAAPLPSGGTALRSAGGGLPNGVVPAQRRALLYVSAFNGPLYAFTYPQGKPVGQVTTYFGGAGICSDREGNVYVDTPTDYTVFVFPHGGLFPLYELSEASEGALPYGCAVDPRTGDLAVTNLEGFVSVYKRARGTPQAYSLPGLYEAFFCAYDDKGNLFATGDDNSGRFALAELPAASGSAKAIAVNASIATGFGIAWDGKDLVLQSGAVSGSAPLLRIKVKGSSGTVVGTTTLAAPVNSSPAQFVLAGHTVVEPDSGNSDVGFWPYPAGGSPMKTLQSVGSELIGVTISR
ncbi:MAG: hypothetical protein WBF19_10475 [Candidatus Cybelea sp.]